MDSWPPEHRPRAAEAKQVLDPACLEVKGSCFRLSSKPLSCPVTIISVVRISKKLEQLLKSSVKHVNAAQLRELLKATRPPTSRARAVLQAEQLFPGRSLPAPGPFSFCVGHGSNNRLPATALLRLE
ncbi:hypothetical protein KIL84_006047 [Mauremys mutica]|uniref:Uncharacterized protein n=1 Tax=Mauremys mutica TaxID=74926 RepID=A0A9D4AXD9_9SAUR|nr:hypothetical protein KIL84_006047 [Mauremys mutica]